MAQPRVPLNVCTAARLGNYALVEEWLVNGGDANLNLALSFSKKKHLHRTSDHQLGVSTLSYAAEWGRLGARPPGPRRGRKLCASIRLERRPEESTALLLAVEGARAGDQSWWATIMTSCRSSFKRGLTA